MARSRRWVIDERSPKRLADVLASMNTGTKALGEGRVFVGRVRTIEPTRCLRIGEVVEVYSAPPMEAQEQLLVSGRKQGSIASCTQFAESAKILAQDWGLVATYKPAGMPTIPDHRGIPASLQAWTAIQLGLSDWRKLHPTSRLDTEVSGVVVFALTTQGRALASSVRQHGSYRRRYAAIAAGRPQARSGIVDLPIGRAADPRHREVGGRDAAESTTRYWLVDEAARAALFAIEPATGRTHQIRVHMAHVGAALVGDALYGGDKTVVLATGAVRSIRRVALHAAWVDMRLPSGESWRVDAPIPQELRDLWMGFGGKDEAWQAAVARDL